MVSNGIVKSVCDLCSRGCGVLIEVKDGKPAKIEGDPDSPVNKGYLCIKGLASLDYLYHPDRLKYPLKRVGERGEGSWQRISWDTALDTIAGELTKTKDRYGAKSAAFIHGAAKGYRDSYPARLANVFGTPNVAWQGHVCAIPRALGMQFTLGTIMACDYEHTPSYIINWASNTADTLHYTYNRILKAIDRGSKLIVIDPMKTRLAQKAELWLRIRPGSDLALALGMINVIINENLYDSDFVKNWTHGFDKLQAHVQEYTPDKVSEITWIPSDIIRETARVFAKNRPSCILLGNGIDQNINSFQMSRSASILTAITGNLDIPGGYIRQSPVPLIGRKSAELELWDKLPKGIWNERVGAKLNPLPTLRYVTPQSIIKAILDEEPYPIYFVYIQGCNPLLTYSNSQETYKALKKLKFSVVADMFMTPTAALADIVLPAASYLEYDSIEVAQVQQKVAQIGECRSDYEMISGLAEKLGLGDYFWENEEQCLDNILKPAGLTFDEFRTVGVISPKKQNTSSGFATPSSKVEIYSDRLEEWGFDPLPKYCELPETPYSNPDLYEEYPLILTTWKAAPYRHSGGRQIAKLRNKHPDPIISINTDTASKLGIEDNEWVYIETKRGRIKQKAKLTDDIDPRVVAVDYGWWFPEKGSSEGYGWAESNVNILTDNNPPYSPEMGSNNMRGILCKVSKM